MTQKKLVIIFDQYTGKKAFWKNEEGTLFQIIEVLDFKKCELERMFIEKDKVIELSLQGYFSSDKDAMKLLELELGTDENNNEFIVKVDVLRFAQFKLDKDLEQS